MSGIYRHALTEKAVLCCDRCPSRWESEPYQASWSAYVDAARPALDLGWRVYRGTRCQFTYCPEHGPTVPMTLVHPREIR